MIPLSAASQTKSGAGPSDAALVVAARAGETWAFEALFYRHAGRALGLAYRIMPSNSDADDLVQDAFIQAFEGIHSLKNPQAFQAWLSLIVVRTTGKRLRKRRVLARLGLYSREAINLDEVVSKTAPPDVAAELRSVYGLLEELPVQERLTLVLKRVEGMDLPEIAEHLGVSLSTVKRRLASAEARLQKVRR